MEKYTLGIFITVFGVTLLVFLLTQQYAVGAAAGIIVIGVSYMISGVVGSVNRSLRSIKS
jgi:hypothetical protein